MLRKAPNESTQDFITRAIAYNAQELIVEYAYPSSSTAKYYKMNKTGCYYISQKNPKGSNLPRIRFSRTGFIHENEAEDAYKEWGEIIA